MSDLTPEEIRRMAEGWSVQGRAAAADLVKALVSGEIAAWYCTGGRTCDGKPHKGYPYAHARGDQWPPPGQDWFVWFLSGGRGSGKTRTGAEYTRRMSERVGRIALVAPTGADVRDTMIEGESGLRFVCARAGQNMNWEPSKRRVTFENGAIATTFSAEEPDRLRGPQHGFAWLDEPAHMPQIESVWDNLLFGLRLGTRPHVVLTSTPIPSKWVKNQQSDPDTKVVRVSTYANLDNLAPTFKKLVVDRYEGTRTGRQELYGELLSDVVGAQWNDTMLHRKAVNWEDLDRIVVGVDPAGTANKRSDETGIIVAGVMDGECFVLHDSTNKYSPQGWAQETLGLYERFKADAIVVEKNFGGDMVKDVLLREDRGLKPRVIVKQATRGKAVRAEPVVALYEQEKVFHFGNLTELEDEMTTWIPNQGPSPNRVDALVWAVTELMQPVTIARIVTARGGTIRGKGDPDAPRRRIA